MKNLHEKGRPVLLTSIALICFISVPSVAVLKSLILTMLHHKQKELTQVETI